MSVSDTTNRQSYACNGVTTGFSFAHPFHAQADLVVLLTLISTGAQTTQTLTTHYTISGTQDAQGFYQTGGTILMVTAPSSLYSLTVYRDPALTQSVDLVENDSLPVETSVEAPLDRLTLIEQRSREIATRTLRQPEGDTADIARLPAKVTRASMYLGFDSNGDPTALATPAGTATVSAFMATVLDDTTAAAARTTLGALSNAAGTITGTELNDSVVNDLTTVTVAGGDYIAIADVSDGNKKKKALVSGIGALAAPNVSVLYASPTRP